LGLGCSTGKSDVLRIESLNKGTKPSVRPPIDVLKSIVRLQPTVLVKICCKDILAE